MPRPFKSRLNPCCRFPNPCLALRQGRPSSFRRVPGIPVPEAGILVSRYPTRAATSPTCSETKGRCQVMHARSLEGSGPAMVIEVRTSPAGQGPQVSKGGPPQPAPFVPFPVSPAGQPTGEGHSRAMPDEVVPYAMVLGAGREERAQAPYPVLHLPEPATCPGRLSPARRIGLVPRASEGRALQLLQKPTLSAQGQDNGRCNSAPQGGGEATTTSTGALRPCSAMTTALFPYQCRSGWGRSQAPGKAR